MFFEECKKDLKKNQKLKVDHICVFGNNEKKRLSKIINAKFHLIGNVFNNNFPIYKKNSKRNQINYVYLSI